MSVKDAVLACPRCDFKGQGLSYFSRGSHVAGLVAATLATLPYALGAGGFLYYGFRREHYICPRCGFGWGRHGEIARRLQQPQSETGLTRRSGSMEGVRRVWSVILFILGAIMLVVGTVELEAIVFSIGLLAAAGGVALHRGANKAREDRRAALIATLQRPVLKLAAERQGRLTVTEVAASLGWSMNRAEKILQSLDDGWRVNSEVTDEGVIIYEFRELLLGRGHSSEVD